MPDSKFSRRRFFVPNTFGPMQQVARETGAPLYEPANILVSDRYFDNLSGQQAFKCFACKIRKGRPADQRS